MLQVLPAAAYRRQAWKNGGGFTDEIARDPSVPTVPYAWRLSRARVEADGPFSCFAGYQRLLVLAEGQGFRLTGLVSALILNEANVLRFPGEAAVNCRLLQGPVTDLGLIYDPLRVQAQIELVTEAAWRRQSGPGVGFLHILRGRAQVSSPGEAEVTLATADSVRIEGARDLHLRTEGDTRVAWLQIARNPS